MLQKHKTISTSTGVSQSVLESNCMSEMIKKRFNSNFIKFFKKEYVSKNSIFFEMVGRIILEDLKKNFKYYIIRNCNSLLSIFFSKIGNMHFFNSNNSSEKLQRSFKTVINKIYA